MVSGRSVGVLASQGIKRLIANGAIEMIENGVEGRLQPASLDLCLGGCAYRIRGSFLPGTGASVLEKLERFSLHEIDLTNGAVLEAGCVYLIPLLEHLVLPKDISASTNPKSSTGRVDVFTRVITDEADAFDTIRAGYTGPLYLEISPRTFPILVRRGSCLSQIRFRCGITRCSDDELYTLHQAESLISQSILNLNGGIKFSVDLSGEDTDGLIGFRAKKHTSVLDMDLIDHYNVHDFWDPIYKETTQNLILYPDCFYILASKETVTILPVLAAELVPFDPLIGEFRVHYAGFFDPGFGYGLEGAGSRVVMEVRSYEVPFILEHGQIIGRLVYEKMRERSTKLYGDGAGSNYQGQGLRLSKHFKKESI